MRVQPETGTNYILKTEAQRDERHWENYYCMFVKTLLPIYKVYIKPI